MSTVLVLNGPNLGRLGTREPEIYGSRDARRPARAAHRGCRPRLTIDLRQTDDEARCSAGCTPQPTTRTPVILNAGAWTHYSYALQDAVSMVTKAGITVVEVHISNPHAREEFRHTSVLTPVVTGVIAGFGFESYRLALAYIRRNALTTRISCGRRASGTIVDRVHRRLQRAIAAAHLTLPQSNGILSHGFNR